MSWSDIPTVYILLFTGVRSLLCLSVVAPLSFIEFVVRRVWGGVDGRGSEGKVRRDSCLRGARRLSGELYRAHAELLGTRHCRL